MSTKKTAEVTGSTSGLGIATVLAAKGINIVLNGIESAEDVQPMVEKQTPDTTKARGMTEEELKRDVLLAAQPNEKFATIEEIETLAAFLASDDAGSITGSAMSVNGGWTAH